MSRIDGGRLREVVDEIVDVTALHVFGKIHVVEPDGAVRISRVASAAFPRGS